MNKRRGGNRQKEWLVGVGLNWWVFSLFACQKVLLFTVCVWVLQRKAWNLPITSKSGKKQGFFSLSLSMLTLFLSL